MLGTINTVTNLVLTFNFLLSFLCLSLPGFFTQTCLFDPPFPFISLLFSLGLSSLLRLGQLLLALLSALLVCFSDEFTALF